MILRWCMHPIQKQMTLLTNWIVQVSTKHSLHFAFCFSFICCRRRRHSTPANQTEMLMFYLSLSVCARALIQWIIRSRLAWVHWTQIHSLSFPLHPTEIRQTIVIFLLSFVREDNAKWKENTLFIRLVVAVNWISWRRKKGCSSVGYNEPRWRRRRSQLV